MEPILIVKEIDRLEELKNRCIVVETDAVEKIEPAAEAIQRENTLYYIKLHVKQDITAIAYRDEWQKIPLVIYPTGLGAVRDLIALLPLLKRLNVKFFLNSAREQSYEAVQILSSLGIYSGIVINEHADWERLTDLMYYALCGKVAHAPIEPFQYLYDIYNRNMLADYGAVFFEDTDFFTTQYTKDITKEHKEKSWQKFFYEATPCAACAGWRICMGKYADLEDKTGCQTFTIELLDLIESLKFRKQLTIKN